MMLDTMFDGNQTSFNIIQHHATSCNMVAKRVQHVGFNNVGWCCINMLDPFGRALKVTWVRRLNDSVDASSSTIPLAFLSNVGGRFFFIAILI